MPSALNKPTSDVRVLVTGAGGFLGRHLVRVLRARGVDVIATVRSAKPDSDDHIAMDVADADAVADVFTQAAPSHVVHCAAYGVDQSQQDYGESFAVNVGGTLNVLTAAKAVGVRRFIHVGSCSEYASSALPIPEDTPQRPNNLYATTKAAASLLLRQSSASCGVPVVIVRPFGLWGPGEPAFRLVPQVIAACRAREPLDLTPCDIVRDYTFVADMARWMAAITLDVTITPGTIVNLASGKGVLLRDFALWFAQALDGSEFLRFGARPHRPNEQHSLVAEVGRLNELLPSRPLTSLTEGLRQMLDEHAA